MNINIEDLSATRKKIEVFIPTDEVSAIENELLGEFSKEANVQGFRPGKAPAALIRKRFKREVAAELQNRVLTTLFEKVKKDSELDVLNIIEGVVPEINSGEDLEFTMTVDVLPKFELPEYKGIEVSLPNIEATDEEVENAIQSLLGQRAEYVEVEKAIEAGDYVRLSYTGKIGDELIADLVPGEKIWGTQNFTWEEAGNDEVPGVKAIIHGIIGQKKDDKAEYEQDFADDFEVEELRGKKAVYSVEIHEVREKKIPELTEEFVKEFSADSVDKFKERIGLRIKQEKQNRNEGLKREKIMGKICDAVEIELPESSLEAKAREFEYSITDSYLRRGVQVEDKGEEIQAEARELGGKRLKAQFIMNAIAEKEQIQIDEQSLSNVIVREASYEGKKPEDFVKELKKDKNKIERLKLVAAEEKILDFLVKHAKVDVDEGAAKPEAVV